MGVMLTTKTEGRTTVGGHPVAVQLRCDHCGEDLDPGGGELAAWEPDDQARYLEVVLLHEGCLEGHRGGGQGDRHRRIRKVETSALERFLTALVHNLEIAG